MSDEREWCGGVVTFSEWTGRMVPVRHRDVIPVTQDELIGGETVAHLCRACGAQLPAELASEESA